MPDGSVLGYGNGWIRTAELMRTINMKRDELPQLERAVSDALDEYLSRLHGIFSGWAYPIEFLQFLKERGYSICSYSQNDGEHCQICGRPYLLVWNATDYLWHDIVSSDESGLLCPDCFDREARQRGIYLIWKCCIAEVFLPKE